MTTAHLHLNPYLLYGKASLGQIRALWFFLGRDFAVQTVSKETVQAVYFCFGAKPADSKNATKTAKKSDRFSPGAPTRKRTRRQEGAGAKVPGCAIAAGRWVGRQTRCLLSVLTKRAINSMKTGQFILNSQMCAQRVPPRIHRCAGI